MSTPRPDAYTPEQAARDMLERMDMPNAQSLSAGDVGEVSQAIAESWELARLQEQPTPWEFLPYAEKQQRESAMHRAAGAAGFGASITTDFPWQGRVSISGTWTIADLRKLLAAMEGR
jgi:hypothetical protein